jgi:pilus assembly protein Flp/PilA
MVGDRPSDGAAGGELGSPLTEEQAMHSLVKRFIEDESGATAIEYGLIAAGISLAIITVAHSVAAQLKSGFSHLPAELAKAVAGGGS